MVPVDVFFRNIQDENYFDSHLKRNGSRLILIYFLKEMVPADIFFHIIQDENYFDLLLTRNRSSGYFLSYYTG